MKSIRTTVAGIALAAVACGGLANQAQTPPGDAGAGTDAVARPPDSGGSCVHGETRCSGTCVDTQTDSKNCGGCGLACDGKCVAARCVVTLASGAWFPRAMAVDGKSVYWSIDPAGILHESSLMSVPLGGGAVTTLASTSNKSSDETAFSGVALDAAHVYWASGTASVPESSAALLSVPLGGGATRTLATALSSEPASLPSILGLAVRGENAYGSAPGGIARVPLDGGAAVVLAALDSIAPGISLDSTSIYWIVYETMPQPSGPSGTVMKMPLGGGTPTTLASRQKWPVRIAVDATSVYWLSSTPSIFGDPNPGSDIAVLRMPLGGGAPETVVSGKGNVAMTIDEASIYWAQKNAVVKVPLAGGAITTLAEDPSEPTAIAVDATSVYWLTAGNVLPNSLRKVTPK